MPEWPEVYPREFDARISKVEQDKYPWVFKCSNPGCYWVTGHKTDTEAHRVRETHKCGQENRMPKGDSSHSVPSGPSLIQQAWDKLEEATRVVLSTHAEIKMGKKLLPDEQKSYDENRGAARAWSEAVFMLSKPGYTDVKEVSKLAVALVRALNAGGPVPDRVGINGYNPHIDNERAKVKPVAPATAKAPATPAALAEVPVGGQGGIPTDPVSGELVILNTSKKRISQADIEAITQGLNFNIPEDSLAKVYKIKLEDVRAIKALSEK